MNKITFLKTNIDALYFSFQENFLKRLTPFQQQVGILALAAIAYLTTICLVHRCFFRERKVVVQKGQGLNINVPNLIGQGNPPINNAISQQLAPISQQPAAVEPKLPKIEPAKIEEEQKTTETKKEELVEEESASEAEKQQAETDKGESEPTQAEQKPSDQPLAVEEEQETTETKKEEVIEEESSSKTEEKAETDKGESEPTQAEQKPSDQPAAVEEKQKTIETKKEEIIEKESASKTEEEAETDKGEPEQTQAEQKPSDQLPAVEEEQKTVEAKKEEVIEEESASKTEEKAETDKGEPEQTQAEQKPSDQSVVVKEEQEIEETIEKENVKVDTKQTKKSIGQEKLKKTEPKNSFGSVNRHRQPEPNLSPIKKTPSIKETLSFKPLIDYSKNPRMSKEEWDKNLAAFMLEDSIVGEEIGYNENPIISKEELEKDLAAFMLEDFLVEEESERSFLDESSYLEQNNDSEEEEQILEESSTHIEYPTDEQEKGLAKIKRLKDQIAIYNSNKNYKAVIKACKEIEELNLLEDARVPLDKAKAYYALGEYEDTIEACQEVLVLEPENIKALLVKAKAYYVLGEYENTIKACQEILVLDPKNVKAFLVYGQALLKKNPENKQLALDQFQKILKINPEYIVALDYIGRIKHEMKLYEDAIEAFDQILNLNPNCQAILCVLSDCLYKTEKWEEGVEVLQQAIIDKGSLDPYVYELYGDGLQHLGNIEEALKMYHVAIKLAPDDFKDLPRFRQKIRAYLIEAIETRNKANQKDDQANIKEISISALDDESSAYLELADVKEHLTATQPSDEVSAGNEVSIKIDVKAGLTKIKLFKDKVKTYQDQKEYQEIIAACEEMEQSNLMEKSELLLYKVKAYYAQGDYEDTIKACLAVLEVDEKNIEAYLFYGRAKLKGNPDQLDLALNAFQDILKIDPQNLVARDYIGRTYYELKEYENAIKVFQEILDIDKEYHHILGLLGDCLCKIGQWEEAVKWFQQAIEKEEKDPHVYELYGSCLRKLGKYMPALEMYKAGSQRAPEGSNIRNQLEMNIGIIRIMIPSVAFPLINSLGTQSFSGMTSLIRRGKK